MGIRARVGAWIRPPSVTGNMPVVPTEEAADFAGHGRCSWGRRLWSLNDFGVQ